MRFVSFFALSLALANCTPALPESTFVCAVDTDCPQSWSCDQSVARCVSHLVDGGHCDPGFQASVDGCVDIDECATPDVCGLGGTCTNAAPGFSCACGSGFTNPPGLGNSCVDIDECARGADDCGWTATCANVDASFGCTCPAGYAAFAHTCVSTCAPGSDTDTGTVNWIVEDLLLFSGFGVDVDGFNNASSGAAGGGVGKTIPGCSAQDSPNGVDNNLATISTTLTQTGLADLPAAFHGALGSGSLAITLGISKLAIGGAADDPCVAVSLTMDGMTTNGVGALANHVLTIDFASPITFSVPLTVAPGDCNGGACTNSELSFTLRSPRGRFELDVGNTQLRHGTLAGFLFYDDVDSSFSSQTSTSQKTYILDWATQTNLGPGPTNTLLSIFEGGPDLRMSSDGTLAPCSGASASAVNRNSISVGLLLMPP